MSGCIQYSARGQAAWITIDNEVHANSLTKQMIEELAEAWHRADQDPDVLVAVVTGAGERHFCAGGDYSELASRKLQKQPDEVYRYSPLQAGIRKPVIAAVNGAAAGAGMTVALDADIVLACRHARFVDPHCGLGLVVSGGPLTLARSVPFTELARIGIAGMDLAATRAYDLGIVSELVDTVEELMTMTTRYVGAITAQSPTAVRLSLQLMRRLRWDENVRQILNDALEKADQQWDHPDAAEGPRAIAEGRRPVWQRI
jgi:E-phenylitaconyl-CoA hydratase